MARAASLGTLNLSIGVNYSGFAKGLKKVTKDLQTFSKDINKINKTLTKTPLTQQIAQWTTLNGQIQQATASLRGLQTVSSKTGKVAAPIGKQVPGQLPEDAMADTPAGMIATGQSIRALANYKSGLSDLNKVWPNTRQGFLDAQKSMKGMSRQFQVLTNDQMKASFYLKLTNDGWRVFSGQLKASADTGIRSMLKFSSFFQKIVHYMTFTLGVQLILGVQRAISGAIESFKEFEAAAKNAAAVSGYVGAAFQEAAKDIEQLSIALVEDTVFTATEASKAMYSLASAGYDVAAMAKDLEGSVAKLQPILFYAQATQSDLESATKAVLVTMKQFNLTLDDTTEIVDSFSTLITNSFATMEKLSEGMKYTGTIAGALNQSLGETGSALAVLIDRGLEGGQAGQRLNMIFNKLIKPTDKAKTMLEGMGISMGEINPETHSLVNILYKLQAAGFGASEASEMFRARTASAAIALVDNVDKIEQFNRKILESQGITEAISEKQLTSLDSKLKMLTQTLTESSIKFGESLKPAITSVADAIKGFMPVLEALGGAFSFLSPLILKIVPAIVSFYIAKKILTAELVKNTAATISNAFAKGGLTLANLKANVSTILLTGSTKLLTLASNTLAAATGALFGVIQVATTIFKEGKTAADWFKIGLYGLSTVMLAAIPILKLFGYSLHAALGPIGLITLGITVLLDVLGVFNDTTEEAKKSLKEFTSAFKDLKGDYKDTESELYQYNKTKKDHLANLAEEIRLTKELRSLTQQGLQDTIKYAQVQRQLADVSRAREDSEKAMLSITARVLSIIQKISPKAEKAVSSYKDFISTQGDINKAKKDAIKLDNDILASEQKLNDIISKQGAASQEYASEYANYISLQNEKSDNDLEQIELAGQLEAAEDAYNDTLDKTSGAIRQAIEYSAELQDTRQELLILSSDLAKAEADLNALSRIGFTYQRNFAEGSKNLREEKEKLYEIELKMYKLDEDRGNQLEELFAALAEEGLLTQDIIDNYVDMQRAEGDVITAGVSLAKVLSNLSIEDQDLVTDWIEVYREGLISGLSSTEAFEAANDAIPGVLSDIVGSGSSAYNVILRYATAAANAAIATRTFEDVIVPFTDDLMENEIVSNRAAEALTELFKTDDDAEQFGQEFIEQIEKMEAAVMRLSKTSALLFAGVGDFDADQFGGDFDLKELITKDSDETIMDFMQDISKAPAGSRDFIDAIHKINKETGYFTDETASAEKVFQEYIAYVQDHGVEGLQAYSTESALAAVTMKALVEQGFEESQILEILGGDFLRLGSDGVSALGNLSGGFTETSSKVNDLESDVDDLQSKLMDLTAEDYIINIVVKVKEEKEKKIAEEETQKIVDMATGAIKAVFPPAAAIDSAIQAAKDPGVNDILGRIVTTNPGLSGIFGFSKGGITKRPTFGMFGEDGAEAIIPLEKNKGFGMRILDEIIPKYYPDLMYAQGGVFGSNKSVSYSTVSDSHDTAFQILGPVNVQASNLEEFSKDVKYRYGMNK